MYSIYSNPTDRDALIKLLDCLNSSDMCLLSAYMDGYERGRLDSIVKELEKRKNLNQPDLIVMD